MGSLARNRYLRPPLALAITLAVVLTLSNIEPALSVTIFEFGIPVLSQPRQVAVDSSGKIWFTTEGVDGVGSFDPASGVFSLVTRPAGSSPDDIVVDPDGNVWISDPGTDSIARVSGSDFIEYKLAANADPQGITAGKVGGSTKIYFVEKGLDRIGELDPATGVIREWQLATTADPQNIAFDSSSRVWFTETGATDSKIGLLNPTTNVLTEYTIFGSGLNLYGIDSDSAGNVWFTANPATDGRIGRLTFLGGLPNVQMFVITLGSITLREIATDDLDNVWFTAFGSNKIGKFDRFSNFITLFSLPAASNPFGVAQGLNNEVWFTENALSANKLGRIIQGPPFRTITLTTVPRATTTTTPASATVATTFATIQTTTSSVTAAAISTSTVATGTSTTTQTETIPVVFTAISATSTSIIATTTISGTFFTTQSITVTSTSFASATASTTITQTVTTTTTSTSITTTQTRTTQVGTVVVNPPIPGFPIESILAGLVFGLIALLLVRRRRTARTS